MKPTCNKSTIPKADLRICLRQSDYKEWMTGLMDDWIVEVRSSGKISFSDLRSSG